MKYILYFFLILLLGACEDKELEELEGHWHMRELFPTANSSNAYNTLDISLDTSILYDKGIYGSEGIWGWVDLENDELNIGGECFSLNLKYSYNADYLILSEVYYDDQEPEKFIARKCDKTLCDKQFEYFNFLNFEMDLPLMDSEGINIAERSLLFNIYFGKDLVSNLEERFSMFNGWKEFDVKDLDLWREKHFIIIPENRWSKVKYGIYGHKKTPMKLISPVFEWYKEKEIDTIYFATRKMESDIFKILWKPVAVSDLDLSELDGLLLEEWLDN